MERLLKLIILFNLLPLVTAGCKEEDFDPPVSFEFRLLDEDGNPSTEFEEGENIVLSFIILNNSSETITFQSMETEEFLKVYKLGRTQGDPIVNVGKPYKNIFCTYQNGYPIHSNDTLKIEIPWNPSPWEPGASYYSSIFCGINENPPLAKGLYKTGFKSVFNFTKDGVEFSSNENEFEITFNIF